MVTIDVPFQFLVSPRIPPELILETIQYLPFEHGKKIAAIRSISPRLGDLITTYEHSITQWFMRKELRHAWSDFPCKKSYSLAWLAQCVERYDVIDAVMEELTWPENRVAAELHNFSVVHAGLLLLYQLVSVKEHGAIVAFIKSLPLSPLTAIYLAIHHATLTARYYGHGWIHQRTYGRFMDANKFFLRNELEFCFAEATLSIGPDFIFNMLVNPLDPVGEITLLNFYHDHGTHNWEWPCWGSGKGEFEPPRTRGPPREPGSIRGSLFTTMLERMAELVKCPLNEVRDRIEVHSDGVDHELAYLNLGGKARLIRGLDVERARA